MLTSEKRSRTTPVNEKLSKPRVSRRDAMKTTVVLAGAAAAAITTEFGCTPEPEAPRGTFVSYNGEIIWDPENLDPNVRDQVIIAREIVNQLRTKYPKKEFEPLRKEVGPLNPKISPTVQIVEQDSPDSKNGKSGYSTIIRLPKKNGETALIYRNTNTGDILLFPAERQKSKGVTEEICINPRTGEIHKVQVSSDLSDESPEVQKRYTQKITIWKYAPDIPNSNKTIKSESGNLPWKKQIYNVSSNALLEKKSAFNELPDNLPAEVYLGALTAHAKYTLEGGMSEAEEVTDGSAIYVPRLDKNNQADQKVARLVGEVGKNVIQVPQLGEIPIHLLISTKENGKRMISILRIDSKSSVILYRKKGDENRFLFHKLLEPEEEEKIRTMYNLQNTVDGELDKLDELFLEGELISTHLVPSMAVLRNGRIEYGVPATGYTERFPAETDAKLEEGLQDMASDNQSPGQQAGAVFINGNVQPMNGSHYEENNLTVHEPKFPSDASKLIKEYTRQGVQVCFPGFTSFSQFFTHLSNGGFVSNVTPAESPSGTEKPDFYFVPMPDSVMPVQVNQSKIAETSSSALESILYPAYEYGSRDGLEVKNPNTDGKKYLYFIQPDQDDVAFYRTGRAVTARSLRHTQILRNRSAEELSTAISDVYGSK